MMAWAGELLQTQTKRRTYHTGGRVSGDMRTAVLLGRFLPLSLADYKPDVSAKEREMASESQSGAGFAEAKAEATTNAFEGLLNFFASHKVISRTRWNEPEHD